MGLQEYWEQRQSKIVNKHLTMGRIYSPVKEQRDMWDKLRQGSRGHITMSLIERQRSISLVQQQGILSSSWQGSDWWKLHLGKTVQGLNQYTLGFQPGLEEGSVDLLISFQPILSNLYMKDPCSADFPLKSRRKGVCVYGYFGGEKGWKTMVRWGKRYTGNGEGVRVGGKGTSSRPTLSALWGHNDS